MKVRDLMSADVVTLHADSPLVAAEEIMGWRRFRHLPVVEGKKGDKKLVGLVTHRDLLRTFATKGGSPQWIESQILKARTTVREILHANVTTIGPDEDLAKAAQALHTGQYGCLPVVDGEGNLVGILTEADFVHLAGILVERLMKNDPKAVAEIKDELKKKG